MEKKFETSNIDLSQYNHEIINFVESNLKFQIEPLEDYLTFLIKHGHNLNNFRNLSEKIRRFMIRKLRKRFFINAYIITFLVDGYDEGIEFINNYYHSLVSNENDEKAILKFVKKIIDISDKFILEGKFITPLDLVKNNEELQNYIYLYYRKCFIEEITPSDIDYICEEFSKRGDYKSLVEYLVEIYKNIIYASQKLQRSIPKKFTKSFEDFIKERVNIVEHPKRNVFEKFENLTESRYTFSEKMSSSIKDILRARKHNSEEFSAMVRILIQRLYTSFLKDNTDRRSESYIHTLIEILCLFQDGDERFKTSYEQCRDIIYNSCIVKRDDEKIIIYKDIFEMAMAERIGKNLNTELLDLLVTFINNGDSEGVRRFNLYINAFKGVLSSHDEVFSLLINNYSVEDRSINLEILFSEIIDLIKTSIEKQVYPMSIRLHNYDNVVFTYKNIPYLMTLDIDDENITEYVHKGLLNYAIRNDGSYYSNIIFNTMKFDAMRLFNDISNRIK